MGGLVGRLLGRAACIAILALAANAAVAAERPDWAFPATEKVQPPSRDDGKPKTAPGSTLSLTRAQIDDLFNAPDWYPDMHPPMPSVVAHGNKEAGVRACASCHLPTGTGHDESAYVAGLPAAYFIRQMADYKHGERKGSGMMINMAKTITDQEIKEAAEYFASLKPRPWIRVVETDTVPKTFVGPGNKRLAHPDGGTEPIGQRVIEIPENEDIVLNRDPRSGFVAYVPSGSIAKGESLVTTGGGGKTIPCAICHGPTLQGLGDVPAIAGRHPNYIVRQLWSMQNGERVGNSAALMKAVVAKLDTDDMLAIAAYVASRAP
jgi:cytochrome c553